MNMKNVVKAVYSEDSYDTLEKFMKNLNKQYDMLDQKRKELEKWEVLTLIFNTARKIGYENISTTQKGDTFSFKIGNSPYDGDPSTTLYYSINGVTKESHSFSSISNPDDYKVLNYLNTLEGNNFTCHKTHKFIMGNNLEFDLMKALLGKEIVEESLNLRDELNLFF